MSRFNAKTVRIMRNRRLTEENGGRKLDDYSDKGIKSHLASKAKSQALKKKVRTETNSQYHTREKKADDSFDKAYKNRFGK